MRIPAAVALIALAGASVQARGQTVATLGLFQGNAWGTSLAEMKKRYPGGYSPSTRGDGQLVYAIMLEVAGRKNTVAVLSFNRAGKFQRAFLEFPKAGTPVDLKAGKTTPGTPEEVAATHKTLHQMLVQQYGAPRLDDPKTGTLWEFPNGTIYLNPPSGAVGLGYSAPDAAAPSGL